VELLLASAVSGVVALATAAMLGAVSYGTRDGRDLRTLLVRQATTRARLDAATRSAVMVLDHSDNHVLLWMGDTRENDSPDLSELMLIEWNSSPRELQSRAASFPASYTQDQVEAADATYSTDDDFGAIIRNLKAGSLFPAQTWCKGVTQVRFDLDNETEPQAARLVSYRVGTTSGRVTDVLAGAGALRNGE
jgi:hypothetical protein